MKSPCKTPVPARADVPPVVARKKAPAAATAEPALPRIKGYDVQAQIGVGGMATVYRARCNRTGKIVAIKVLAEEMAAKPVLRKRFEQEIRTAARLEHPNIVATLGHGDTDAGPYLVMEYVDGESLGSWIQRNGPLPPGEAVRLMSQVAEALEYAHSQGVIHRDVKPDNILITSEGDARLADFGLVKLIDDDADLTRPGTGLGTPSFMPPEQLAHAKAIDHRCDIYGLGATLYMAVTGRVPFAAKTLLQMFKLKSVNQFTPPRQLAPKVSKELERTIYRAMNPERDQRHPACTDLLRDLAECAAPSLEAFQVQGESAEIRPQHGAGRTPTDAGVMVRTRHGATHRTDLIGDSRGTRPTLAPLRGGLSWRFVLIVAAVFAVAFGGALVLCDQLILK